MWRHSPSLTITHYHSLSFTITIMHSPSLITTHSLSLTIEALAPLVPFLSTVLFIKNHTTLQRDKEQEMDKGPWQANAPMTVWNNDCPYPAVLVGHYTARRRHDGDKQEVRLSWP